MLRRLHRLLLAVIAVVVCIAVTGPFRGIVGVRASIATTNDIARARWIGAGDDSHRSADVAPDTDVDLEAIETELDDEEDDALNDVADDMTTFALTCAPQPALVPPHHVELSSDTSRRHHHTIFARGPPT
jgi:hypothetical protein